MKCSKCGQDKDVSNFYKQSKKNYYRSTCKECYSIQSKNNNTKNSGERKAKKKEYYQKNKRNIFEYISNWRKNNQEKVKQYEKKSRDANADKKITWTQNRRARIKGLNGSFTHNEWIELL